MNRISMALLPACALSIGATAAPLSTNTRTVLPAQIQQIISVDYRALRNSPSGIELKNRVLPANLKTFETSLQGLGLTPDTDINQLTFVSYRTPKGTIRTFGVADAQFDFNKLKARFKKAKIKGEVYHDATLWPVGGGFVMTYLDANTTLFGDPAAVKDGLDVSAGEQPSVAAMSTMMEMIVEAEDAPVWSVLDSLGTQNMLFSALGEASTLGDYDTIRQRLLGSHYTLDLHNGVNFDLSVVTSDSLTAGTLSGLMRTGMLYEKTAGTAAEKSAVEGMDVNSDSARLVVTFKADDTKFQALVKSDLFQAFTH